MEASATTLNISSPEVPHEQRTRSNGHRYGKHNHGPTFGKYVAGCPECIHRCPDGPPASGYIGKAPKVKVKATEVVDKAKASLEQKAAELIAQLESANARALEAESRLTKSEDPLSVLVQTMLRREAKTIEKEEDVERRKQAAREDMLRVTREQEAQKLERQANCGHTKENGRSAINGQVHNDGLYHPICLRCMKEFSPQQVGKEAISNGMQAV